MSVRAVVAAAVLLAAAPALAQTPPAPPADQGGQGGDQAHSSWAEAREKIRKACEADLKTYCSDLKPDQRPGMCLRQNEDKLSPDCKAAMDDFRAQMRQQRGQQ